MRLRFRENPGCARLWVVGLPLSGISARPALRMQAAPATRLVPRSFASLSVTRWTSRCPSTSSASRSGFGLLSWSSFKDRPSVDVNRLRPLPANRGKGLPRPVHVPSLPFLTTPTVYSASDLAGLLHPATDHGVHLVLSRPLTVVLRRAASEEALLCSCRDASEDAVRPGLPRFDRSRCMTDRRSVRPSSQVLHPPKLSPPQQRFSLSPGPLPSRRCSASVRRLPLHSTSRLSPL